MDKPRSQPAGFVYGRLGTRLRMQSSHTLSLLFEGVAARSCTGVHCSNRQRARRNTERSSATLIYSWIYTLDKTVDPARFAARQEEKSLVS